MDILTLIVVTAVISLGSTLYALLIYKLKFPEKGILFWVFGTFSIACSLILLTLRNILPGFLTIVVANLFITYGFAFIWSGMRRFIGRSRMIKTTIMVPLLTVPFMYWFSEIQPVLWIRIIVASLAITFFSGAISIELLKDYKFKTNLAQKILGAVFIINTTVFIIRIFLTIIQKVTGDFLMSGAVTIGLFLWTSVFFISITSGMVLMISERLMRKQKKAEDDLKASNEKLEELINKKLVELQKSKDRYQAIFENKGTATGTLRNDGIIDSCNKKTEELLGFSRDEIIGKLKWSDFVDENDFDRLQAYNTNPLNNNGKLLPDQYECNIITKSGENKCVAVNIGSIDDIRIVTLNDITERKENEIKLIKSQKIARLGNYHWNLQTQHVEWSDEMYNIFGLSKENYDPNKENYLDIVHPDDHHLNSEEYIKDVISKPEHTGEYRIIDQTTEKIKYIQFWGETKFDKNGKPLSVFGIFQDISNRKRTEIDKNELEKKLLHAQKMESIGQLAGGIAHDFNNILYPIIGFTQLSQSELSKDHPVQENLTDILNGALRAKDLVKRILHFSRQQEHELKPMILQPVINESCKLLRSTIPSNIDLRMNLYDGREAVLCDDSEIHEILLNLCTNAYHAIAGNKGNIIIGLSRQDPPYNLEMLPGKYLCLSVKDNGVGIPEKIKDKMYEPYVTTKEIGKGSGLGLSVVYGIVQNYNGGIKVESSPTKGTVFEIYLPITDESAHIENNQVIEDPNESENEHILFVDDEGAIVKLGVRALKNYGYRVTGIKDSTEALKLFEANPNDYDLVITDMAMPGMVGSELAKRILDTRPDVPIIICSGYSEKLDKLKAKDLNISTLLDKPISVESLVKSTREILDKKVCMK